MTGSSAAGSGGVATDDTGHSTNPNTSAPQKPTMPSGTCASGSAPVVETCDNVDNDCDGKIDEDVQRSCGAAMVGLCHLGKQSCKAGAWGACEGAVDPVMEVCDTAEQDENCDGAANEGCACTPGMTKPCGKTVGICMTGQQTCLATGMWGGECAGEVKPMPEVCDGKQDEDCDGLADDVDDDCQCVAGTSAPCVAGKGLCAEGMKTCANGKWSACQGPAPKKEVCDGKGVDEDCDGTADNGCACTNGESRPCPGGKDTGECSVGMQTCSNGQWSACSGSQGPAIESCDGKDSNCNGVSDDGEPNLCAGGKPCVQSGSKWACAKCTPASVAQDCPGASTCRTANCTSAGQCKLDDAPELTGCPGKSTHEAYCMAGSCTSPLDANGKSSMPAGSALYPGGMLRSPGGEFEFEYQADGNVTLWAATRSNSGDFVWCLFNTTKPTDGGALVMQPDGNFVLWAEDNALWQSGTGRQADSRLTVSVTDGGHVLLKDKYGSTVREVVGDFPGNVQAN